MQLYERDYLNGLTEKEKTEYEEILAKEKEGKSGFGRKNFYYQYPLAVRNLLSLFPNNHLDIIDLKANSNIDNVNNEFRKLLLMDAISERDILNYINHTPAFHVIGSVIRGCELHVGHHGAYLFPEFPLGTSYKADYLLIGNGSGGHEFIFVELENPKGNITLQNGELGNTFRKGILQVKDWQRWLQENYAALSEYFESRCSHDQVLPKEFLKYDSTRIRYVVVAGLRKDFSEKTYRIAREYRDNEKIYLLHYDNLYDFACRILNEPTY